MEKSTFSKRYNLHRKAGILGYCIHCSAPIKYNGVPHGTILQERCLNCGRFSIAPLRALMQVERKQEQPQQLKLLL